MCLSLRPIIIGNDRLFFKRREKQILVSALAGLYLLSFDAVTHPMHI